MIVVPGLRDLAQHHQQGRLAGTITTAGGTAIAASADVGDERAVAELFDQAEKAFGGVDVVVNAAGRMDLARWSTSPPR